MHDVIKNYTEVINAIEHRLKDQNINDGEMLKTFNCGVGFCLIVEPKNLQKISIYFSKEFKPYVIGEITTGNKKVRLNEKINWSQKS